LKYEYDEKSKIEQPSAENDYMLYIINTDDETDCFGKRINTIKFSFCRGGFGSTCGLSYVHGIQYVPTTERYEDGHHLVDKLTISFSNWEYEFDKKIGPYVDEYRYDYGMGKYGMEKIEIGNFT
jgi:hypothetical protein